MILRLIEITLIPLQRLSCADEVLGDYHLAPGLEFNTIIADPAGHLLNHRPATLEPPNFCLKPSNAVATAPLSPALSASSMYSSIAPTLLGKSRNICLYP